MVISSNPDQTRKVAEEFLNKLAPQKTAVIVCLKGELGAGKTTFVQFIAEVLGVRHSVTSPTFVILKSYGIPFENFFSFKNLVHIDAYRLKNREELESLGWREISKNPRNLIFIEWPENVPGLIPEKAVIIEFKTLGELEREIKIKWPKEEKIKNLAKKKEE